MQKHVHVHSGGQAVVGVVEAPGGGVQHHPRMLAIEAGTDRKFWPSGNFHGTDRLPPAVTARVTVEEASAIGWDMLGYAVWSSESAASACRR